MPVEPGNSGGAIANLHGELAGIVVQRVSVKRVPGGEAVNEAHPIIRDWLKQYLYTITALWRTNRWRAFSIFEENYCDTFLSEVSMENAYALFQQIVNGGYDEIKRMVDEHQEENLFIDFKEKQDAASKGASKDDRKIYAKSLSGFSNSSGGVIIWGVKCREVDGSPDYAQELKPIQHLNHFLTDLNKYVHQALIPVNSGVQNIAIEIPGQPDQGFVVTYVPESDLPPHRAMLGVDDYYLRVGDSFIRMEHYMLADAFGRRQKPKLEFYYRIASPTSQGDKSFECQFIVGIKNTGRYLAHYPALRIKGKGLQLNNYGINGNYGWSLNPVPQTYGLQKEKGYLFAGGVNDVIHPGTVLEVAIFHPENKKFMSYNDLAGLLDISDLFLISYEIHAEGTVGLSGTIRISTSEFKEKFIEAIRNHLT
ncbi:ATP-binding protein [Brevibacillus thermoruber]|uniref:ATP-binding protein n=1 Tax=Brevibacillus thermoruber TaxID=33942 RepID=A0A9X3TSZ7_9BACL|nr:ATP-binding protein [Brevibacillus thermoruber]MDA5110527.1 ATP-binding protein [Brevibacillus thermoruber]